MRKLVLAVAIVAGLAGGLLYVAPPAFAQAPIPPSADMVSWWPGDGNFLDITSSHTGVNGGGVTFTPGKVGGAFKFVDAPNSFIAFPNSPDFLPASNQFTIDAWIKPDFTVLGDKLDTIFVKRDGCGLVSYQFHVFKGHRGFVGNIGLSMGVHVAFLDNTSNSEVRSTVTVPNDGQFHFVAVTFDGNAPSPNTKLYLDGVLVGSGTFGPSIPVTSAAPVSGKHAECGFFSSIVIDELEFFKRALTASEITDIFNAGSAGKSKAAAVSPPNPVFTPGKILVSDPSAFGGNGGIILVDIATGQQTALISGGDLVNPTGIVIDTDGSILVAAATAFSGGRGIIRLTFDPSTGQWTQSIVAQGGLPFKDPVNLEFDANRMLIVSDFDGISNNVGRIIKVDPATGDKTIISLDGLLHQPVGLAIAANGDIIVTDFENTLGGPAQVLRINPATGAQSIISSGGLLEDPHGVAISPDGKIWVVDAGIPGVPAGPGRVFVIDPDGTQHIISSGDGTLLEQPLDLAFTPTGELYVLDNGAGGDEVGRIFRIDTVTGAITVISSGNLLKVPLGLAFTGIQPSTGIQPKLIVIKNVTNDNGGTATPSSFTMTVTGASPSPSSFLGASGLGTTVMLNAGTYNVTESGPSGYSSTFSADCSGTIAVGQSKTCTVTNDDNAITVTPDTTPPTTVTSVSPAANAAGWNNVNVTVTLTATDNAGGSGVHSITYTLTGALIGGGTVPGSSTSILITAEGTTTVTYGARDNAGNVEPGKTVIVKVDKTAPAVTVPASMTVNATSPSGAVATFTPTATDATSGVASLTSSPASGSTFPLGATTVTVTATDAAGNTSTASFTVTVRDATPPALTLPAPITQEATGPSGATVSYGTASATDLVDGPRPVSCSPTSGSTFALGVTMVSCSASDTRGNTATGTFTVSVVDTTRPNLTLPANITTDAVSPSGAPVSYTATATDAVAGLRPVTCAPPSGSIFPIGVTTVNCSASDLSGNTATGTFTVTVLSPAQAATNLIATVTSLGFQQGINLLKNALSQLGSGNTTAACNQISAFINQVQAQSGKKLTTAQAAQLIQAATNIRGSLGCS